MAEHRRMWRVWQRFMDPERFVFIDETGAATNMVRRYGWALRGKRLVTAAPHGHWRTTTFVAGLRSTGLVAPPSGGFAAGCFAVGSPKAMVLDGPMNGPAFLAYVEQFLAPTLRRGDVVVMDNLSAHKVAGVAEAFRGRCQRSLPATLLARPEPDRAGVLQAQGPAPACRGPHQGDALDHHRPAPRPLQP